MSLPEEPYTRVERYLAKLAGQDVDIPDRPITRIECYLDYLVNNGGGVPASNAGARNSVFRGQSLGTELTADQSAAIQAGTFDGLFVGDYWTIGGVVYRIAGFDIYLRYGDTEFTDHHAVIVPDTGMASAMMNPTSTAEGGYFGSALRTNVLPTVLTTIESAFGADHILTHRMLLCNQITGNNASGWVWADSKLELLNQGQVMGIRASGGIYNIGISFQQFPLFALAPQYSCNRGPYWLTDATSATSFSLMSARGYINFVGASNEYEVRPYFCIA